MTPDQITQMFARNGDYVFARWGRPIAPVVFGVTEDSLQTVKGACEAVVTLAGHKMAETDPELGSNLMMFFFRDWDELLETPNLDKLVPDLDGQVTRLKQAGATQYRFFRFDDDGAIQAAFVFLRMDKTLSDMPADDLALGQMVQIILLWGDQAFSERSPLAVTPSGVTVLRPEIADLIRAAYDPVMPAVARDDSHALRLSARISAA